MSLINSSNISYNEFNYCPYCGKKLSDNNNKQIEEDSSNEIINYNYKENPVYKKAKYCMSSAVICVLFTLLPFAIVATAYAMRAMDSVKLNYTNLAQRYCKKSIFWSTISIISVVGIVVTAEILSVL